MKTKIRGLYAAQKEQIQNNIISTPMHHDVTAIDVDMAFWRRYASYNSEWSALSIIKHKIFDN